MTKKERMFDFYSPKKKAFMRPCDHEGCQHEGEYRAPKSRYKLNDYYWFCLEHIKEYNKDWNYFKGLTIDEIEDLVERDMLGDRPTRNFHFGTLNQKILHKVSGSFGGDFYHNSAYHHSEYNLDHSTREAFIVLEMDPSFDFTVIKNRYKQMVKKYHPDVQEILPAKQAEEKLKMVNIAFTYLKTKYSNN